MELGALKIFLAVAETGSITRAAELLHCVQPNVTARIRQLEQELGTPLLHRKPRGVSLTPAGRILHRYAEKVCRLVAEAGEAVRSQDATSGALAIGCTPAFAAYRLPTLLRAFRGIHPEVQMQPFTATSKVLEAMVAACELDGAFLNGPLDSARIEQETVFLDELVLVMPRSGASLRDMAHRQALVFPHGCAYRMHLEYWLQRCGFLPYDIVEVGSLEGILSCVASGIGFSMLPRHVVTCSHVAPQLRMEEIDAPLRSLPVVFVQRRPRIRSEALETLCALARAAGAGCSGEAGVDGVPARLDTAESTRAGSAGEAAPLAAFPAPVRGDGVLPGAGRPIAGRSRPPRRPRRDGACT